MNEQPGILDIFSGIGGISAAFHAAGFRTVGFVEFDPIKRVVLEHWFPDGPFYGDIDEFDCQQFLRTHGRPDVIAGGVPCQAISLLGKRMGTADERWKWPQAIRLVGQLQPRFAVFENPAAILNAESGRAFNGILSRMAEIGYDGWWDVIPAAAFGAGHWRERLCIVFADALGVGKRIPSDQTDTLSGSRDSRALASSQGDERVLSPHTNGESIEEERGSESTLSRARKNSVPEFGDASQTIPTNTHDAGLQGHTGHGAGGQGWSSPRRPVAAADLPDLRGRVTGPDWWHEAHSGVPVLASGLPGKLVEAASLCIGDSVVPQAWIPIAQTLYQAIQTSRSQPSFLKTDFRKP